MQWQWGWSENHCQVAIRNGTNIYNSIVLKSFAQKCHNRRSWLKDIDFPWSREQTIPGITMFRNTFYDCLYYIT